MRRSSFPTRLFRWFLSQQILISGILFFALGVGLVAFIESGGFERETTRVGHELVLVGLAAAFVIVVGVSASVVRRMLIPLGRLIDKTRRMRESPFEDESEPEELTFDEPGEWFELERALNRLGRDLRQKTIRLSREKTELRAIMSAVSEAVLAISKEKRILFYNPHFAYLFNVRQPQAEARITEILRSPDVLEAYNEALQTGETVRRDVQIAVSIERLARNFQLSVAPLVKKHNQEVYGAVGILHDITELKQAERIRIEFVGNVSHELRTPLTAVSGYLQTLAEDLESGRLEQAGEFLGIVTQNVTRLKSLVDDLLDLSALESGTELDIRPVNVREITEAVLKQVPHVSHNVTAAYDFDTMDADPARLEQVLRNLMENAVRYVPAGKSIRVHWRARADERLELSVKDDGPGIAPEHQKRLFERFYRVDESRSRAAGGTGIGLSLVKHIVQRHGGHVFVRSELGRGSEFICEFPAQPRPASELQP
jgi:two-component system phosphate regulon sensor histidine kinase PhoR